MSRANRAMQSLVVVAGMLTACAGPGVEQQLRIGVSIPPVGWLVQEIAGSEVDVLVLVHPGESPETYQPTDAQVSALTRSRVYFRSGIPFEEGPWFSALSRFGGPEIVDLSVSEASETGAVCGGRSPIDPGPDPHAWLSLRCLQRQAQVVAETMARLDPVAAAVYRQRFSALKQRLQERDRELEQRLAPYRGRQFLVLHPSWSYFAADYGLEQMAIEQDGKAPTDREVTVLRERASRAGLRVVFSQPQSASRLAETFAEELGARVEEIDPLSRDVIANLNTVVSRLIAAFEESEPR